MNRKIGILTYFGENNPGTFLQAYCLLKALERRFPGDRVELIDYRVRRVYFRPHKRDIYLPNFIDHVRRERIFRRCYKEHFKFSPSALVTRDYGRAAAFIAEQQYDLVVVGSDTVFQFLPVHLASGQRPIYWLPPNLQCRKVACAASSDLTTYDLLDETTRRNLAESIQAFDLIGIRDEMTRQLLDALGLEGDQRVQMVPDPTFTFPIDPAPAASLAQRLGIDRSRPTFFAHPPPHPIADAMVKHCRAKGFREVSLSGDRSADYAVYAVSPFEWAGIYQFFNLTLTDRFHGSVFSLRNGTPVVAIDGHRSRYLPSGLSKTYCLMKQFGCEKTHYVNADLIRDPKEAISIADRAIDSFDADRTRQTCARMADQFNAFLQRIADLLG